MIYSGEHSITFYKEDDTVMSDGINTWNDLKMIPTSRPVFAMPQVKTNFIEVPGMSGSLDISRSLTGYPIYYDRSGSFQFQIANSLSHDGEGYNPYYTSGLYDELNSALSSLQGKRLKAVLEDDPDWYYIGIFSFNEFEDEDGYGTIEIDYRVEPYKIKKDLNVFSYSSETSTTNTLTVTRTELGVKPWVPTFTIGTGSSYSIAFSNPELDLSGTITVANTSGSNISVSYPQYPLTSFLNTNTNTIEITGYGYIYGKFNIGGF